MNTESTYGTDWYASGGFPMDTFCNHSDVPSPQKLAEIRQSLADSSGTEET